MSRVDLPKVLSVPADPPAPWLVPEILCKGSFVVMAGEAGAGKSFVSYSLALALATGRDFLGQPTQPHRVLYFDDENSEPESAQYLRMLWRGMGKPSTDLIKQNLRFEHFSLTAAGSSWSLLLKKYAQEFKPALIIIDTAASSCHLTDENDNAEAMRVIKTLRYAQKEAAEGCALWVLKHAKLDTEAGKWTVRGAKAWVSATDATLMHSRYKGATQDSGFFTTQLQPAKVRVYSLRQALILHPKVEEEKEGLSVNLVASPKKTKLAKEEEL